MLSSPASDGGVALDHIMFSDYASCSEAAKKIDDVSGGWRFRFAGVSKTVCARITTKGK